MPNLTIYKDPSITINVIDGVPPTDQSALVASLQSQVTVLTATLATRTAERDAALAKIAAAQADLA